MEAKELSYLKSTFSHLAYFLPDDPLEEFDPLKYEEPNGDTCLHVAAMNGDLRAATLLIDAGLDVNKQGDMGNTPLHYAISFKHETIVELLVRNGADTSLINEFGHSAKPKND